MNQAMFVGASVLVIAILLIAKLAGLSVPLVLPVLIAASGVLFTRRRAA